MITYLILRIFRLLSNLSIMGFNWGKFAVDKYANDSYDLKANLFGHSFMYRASFDIHWEASYDLFNF